MIENVLVPDGITPALAWRMWRVSLPSTDAPETRLRLRSVSIDAEWPPLEPMHAECGPRGTYEQWAKSHGIHVPEGVRAMAPVESCACGIYARVSTAGLGHMVGPSRGPGETLVLGRVAL